MSVLSPISTAVVSPLERTASFNPRLAKGFRATPTTRAVQPTSLGIRPSFITIEVTQSVAPAKTDPAALAQAQLVLDDRGQALTTIRNLLASTATLLRKLQPDSIQGFTDDELTVLASDIDVLGILSTSSALKGDVDGFAAGVDLSADDVRALLSATRNVFGDIGTDFQAIRDLIAAVDLSLIGGLVLNGPDYSGQDLTGADFAGLDLSGADFRGANLSGADFTGADLSGADLSDAILDGAMFQNATVTAANLTNARLAGANFDSAQGRDAVFRGATMDGAILRNVRFNDADLANASLKQANFDKAHLQGADLTNVDVEDAIFNNAKLQNSILIGVDFTNADTKGAKFNGAIYDPAGLPPSTDPVPALTAALNAATAAYDSAETSLTDVDATFTDLKALARAYTPTGGTETVSYTVAAGAYVGKQYTVFGPLGVAGEVF